MSGKTATPPGDLAREEQIAYTPAGSPAGRAVRLQVLRAVKELLNSRPLGKGARVH